MAGKKGMKRYPASIKAEVAKRQRKGETIRGLSREYGVSRWAIYCWCGLASKPEPPIPKRKGRPRTKPLITKKEMETEIKRLQMEVELLRSFLQAAGRR